MMHPAWFSDKIESASQYVTVCRKVEKPDRSSCLIAAIETCDHSDPTPLTDPYAKAFSGETVKPPDGRPDLNLVASLMPWLSGKSEAISVDIAAPQLLHPCTTTLEIAAARYPTNYLSRAGD